jgi:hypothetical protein
MLGIYGSDAMLNITANCPEIFTISILNTFDLSKRLMALLMT